MFKRLFGVLLVSAFAATLSAQAFTVRGSITDQSGALIPGVAISLHHSGSGRDWMTVSDAQGAFAVAGIPPGEVEVTAELPGFKTSKVKVLLGSETKIANLSIVLTVASVSENVEV